MFSFFIIFFLPSVFAQSPTAIEKSGRFVLMDSYSPEPGPHPYISFFYPDDQTGPYRLNSDTLPPHSFSYAGKRVMLSASFPDSSPVAAKNLKSQGTNSALMLNVDSMQLLDVPAQTTLLQTPLLQTPTTVRSITLLSKFSDVPATPLDANGVTSHDNAYFTDRFYTGTDSLKQFFLASSYGDFTWNGEVNGWSTLPRNQAAYSFNFDLAIADSVALHDPFVNFCSPTPVSNLVIVFNGFIDPSGSAFATLGNFGNIFPADGCNPLVSVTLEPDDGFFCCGLLFDNGLGTTAHEVGHNHGLDHTPPPPGAWLGGVINDPYHDPWSVMSTNFDHDGPSALIMGQRDKRGWVDPGNKVTISSGTTSTVTLDYINESESGSNPQMAIIPLGDGTSYIVEAHHDEQFNDTPLDNEGAMMYRFFPTGNNYAYLTFEPLDQQAQYSLVATAGTDDDFIDFPDANLDVSESFIDSSNNVVVQTLSKTSTTVTVSISNNVSGCFPPVSGDWVITSNCTLGGSSIALGNVIVQNGAVLTIPSGLSLDIDFVNNFLRIEFPSGVLIKAGGTIT